jgi:hypothetical protein
MYNICITVLDTNIDLSQMFVLRHTYTGNGCRGSLSKESLGDACADRGEDRPGDRNDRNNESEIESSLSV